MKVADGVEGMGVGRTELIRADGGLANSPTIRGSGREGAR